MTSRRYPLRSVGDARGRLPPDLTDCLLGVQRTPAEIAQLQARGTPYDSFLTFDVDQWPAERIDALWRTHGRWLRAEAQRRGVAVPAQFRG
jgi:hypothetical protein